MITRAVSLAIGDSHVISVWLLATCQSRSIRISPVAAPLRVSRPVYDYVEQLRAELAQLRQELDQARNERDQLRSELTQAQTTLQDRDHQVERLQQSLDLRGDESLLLREQLTVCRDVLATVQTSARGEGVLAQRLLAELIRSAAGPTESSDLPAESRC